SRDKQIILYHKVADLKGKFPGERVSHHIGAGQHADESRVVMDWAEPGKTAIGFHNGRVLLTCLGTYWYEAAARASPWSAMTRGRAELPLAYFGSADKLGSHISAMLAGKEVILTAIQHDTSESDAYEAMAFRSMPRGVDAVLWRIKASLQMPGTVGKLVE